MGDTSKPGLPRALGPWIAVAIVVGTVIGSGVFLKPKIIAQNVPDFSHVALVWVIGGLLSLLGTLTLAEVAVLFPHAGGCYVFLREGYGRPAGFLWGWVEFWVIRAASIAALAAAFVDGLFVVLQETLTEGDSRVTFAPWTHPSLTILVIAVLAVVNMRGVRWGGGLQFGITLVKVGSLLAILVLPFALGGLRRSTGVADSLMDQSASTVFRWGGLSTAFLGVLWAYHGWMDLAPIAGEVKQPQRTLPLAFLLGIGIVILVYLGANFAYHLVLSQKEMAGLSREQNVASEFCARLVGPIGAVLAAAAIMISVFGALNGNLLVGPRLLYAMGADGLAPRWLSAVHVRYRTPFTAIAVLAGWSILLVLAALWVQDHLELDKSLFDLLTDYAMFGAVIFETLAVTTIFVFRRSHATAPRPYRCPGYPWTPLAFLLVPIFVLVNMFTYQTVEAIVGLGFIALGAVVFWMCYAGKA
jgi:amino acid transporter